MILGITGKAGSGKDTFADMLTEELEARNAKTTTNHFAYALKKIATDCFGWDGQKDEKGRRLLQVLGTECGRAYNDNIWVEKVADWISSGVGTFNFFLIPDTRFPNEAEMVKTFPNMAGAIIAVVRPELNTGGQEYTHTSETALDGYEPDITITNDGTLQDLRQKAAELAEKLISEPAVFSAN